MITKDSRVITGYYGRPLRGTVQELVTGPFGQEARVLWDNLIEGTVPGVELVELVEVRADDLATLRTSSIEVRTTAAEKALERMLA